MSSKLLKKYPSYAGDEPFIYLCFADADEKYIEPLLSKLYTRGCRVWYTVGNSTDLAQEKSVQERMLKAGLVIAVCSAEFHKSPAKSRMMVLQSKNIPVISLDKEPTDNLAAGFREGTPHIKAYGSISDSTEPELISTDGFSQEFIGERIELNSGSSMPGLFKCVLMLTVAAAVAFVLLLTGVITVKQKPDDVRVLTLKAVPENLSELEQYPNLEKIIIPQSEAEKAIELTDNYTVVIRGE